MTNYERVVKFLQDSNVPCAIIGGAVRDRLHDLTLDARDYDIVVHSEYSQELRNAVVNAGGVIRQEYLTYPTATTSHFKQYYDKLYTATLYDLALDILVLDDDKYKLHMGEPQYNSARDAIIDGHFRHVVESHDNTINQCYHTINVGPTFPLYLAKARDYHGIAKQCAPVTLEREARIKEVAARLGWAYVPIER